MYGEGISKTGTILDVAVDADIIKKSGAWYSYMDEKVGQGREKSKDYLDENPAIKNEILKKIYDHYNFKYEEGFFDTEEEIAKDSQYEIINAEENEIIEE